jgi:hypothetical protein
VAKVTSHSAAVANLAADTVYHYRVRSRDAAGNLSVSGDFTFKTAIPVDITAPALSAVAAGNVSETGATITWTTDEASDSRVEFGVSTAYGSSTSLDLSLVTGHAMTLANLTPGTLYHYRVLSRDAAGNVAVSGDMSFTTPAPLPPPPPPPSPVLQWSATSYGAGEADGGVTLTVARGGDTSAAVSVGYTTSDGSALAGADYVSTTGTVSFAPGEVSKTVFVPLVDDASVEGLEVFSVTLVNPAGAALGPQVAASVSVSDNDVVVVGTVQGVAFNDANGNGVQEAGE